MSLQYRPTLIHVLPSNSFKTVRRRILCSDPKASWAVRAKHYLDRRVHAKGATEPGPETAVADVRAPVLSTSDDSELDREISVSASGSVTSTGQTEQLTSPMPTPDPHRSGRHTSVSLEERNASVLKGFCRVYLKH